MLSKTTEIAELRNKLYEGGGTDDQQICEIQKIVDNHQRYLEKADSHRRENNVVIFGLQESENDQNEVNEILHSIVCQSVNPEKVKKLGKPPEHPATAVTDHFLYH